MSIYMTVFKCLCMYVLYAYIRVCMHLCVYACMYICMHVCIHVCISVIFKLGFEQYRGGIVRGGGGIVRGGIVRGGSVRGGGIVQGGNVRAPEQSHSKHEQLSLNTKKDMIKDDKLPEMEAIYYQNVFIFITGSL